MKNKTHSKIRKGSIRFNYCISSNFFINKWFPMVSLNIIYCIYLKKLMYSYAY